jgi:hypothetical protein
VGYSHGFCVVDRSNAWLSFFRWGLNANGYVSTTVDGEKVLLHRLITDAPADRDVDHKDGNPQNNCGGNLRLCTKAENARNTKKPKGTGTPFKGVSVVRGKFRARINHMGKLIHLGYYLDAVEAARAYDVKAVELFGEFARTNFGHSRCV